LQLITIGSPVMTSTVGAKLRLVRFKTADDLVPLMSPLSVLLSGGAELAYTLLPADPDNYTFPYNHIYYFSNPATAKYDPYGYLRPTMDPPVMLGLQRILAITPP
jgi:hypothetical protein